MAESPTKEQYIDEQLKLKKLKNIPANRKKLGNEWDLKYLGGSSKDWKTIFKTEFPQFATLVDGGAGEAEARATFGDDLIDLFLDAAKNPQKYDFNSSAGQRAWKNKVQATKFYQDVLPKHREWDLIPKNQQTDLLLQEQKRLQAAFSDLQLNDEELKNLAVYSLRSKASEIQQRYFAFSLAGKRANQTKSGIPATETAATIKRNLKTLGYQPNDLDAKIQSVLTGEKYNGVFYTEDLLNTMAKRDAKVMHQHYGALIDEGFSLDDIFEPFKQLAAKTLELNPNAITRDNPLFKDVLDLVDDKNMGISGTQFIYQMKNNPKYGYGKTQQARNEVNSIIMNLEEAWGAVR